MTAQYDWSKLPNGWQYVKTERYGDEFLLGPDGSSYNLIDIKYGNMPARLLRALLESCRIPKPSTPPDTATVTALRPADEYDWERLGPYWWYDANKAALVYVSQDGKSDANYLVRDLERRRVPLMDMEKRAKEELERCRIVKPPQSDEYDWSKLEGSGWRHPGDSYAHIECDQWNYYYRIGLLAFRLHAIPTDPDETLRVHQEAHALVAKCRRDWRDEVKQACESCKDLTTIFHNAADRTQDHVKVCAVRFPFATLTLEIRADKSMKLAVYHSKARIDIEPGISELLGMSLIIERLKKLGWREA